MKIVIGIEILVYIFLAPLLAGSLTSPLLILISLTSILGFFAGIQIFENFRMRRERKTNESNFIIRKKTFYLASILWVAYIYVVISHGLLNRRIGTIKLAESYLALNPMEFIVLRVSEILMPLLFILFMQNFKYFLRSERYVFLITLGLAWLCTGVMNSRGILLSTLLVILAFLIIPGYVKLAKKYVYIVCALALAFGAAVTSQRSTDSGQSSMVEVANRLNGLELVKLLESNGVLHYFGNWDFSPLKVLQTVIPWIPGSGTLKSDGLTTTKAFILQNYLHSPQKDIADSFISDSVFIGGVILVAAVSLLIGASAGYLDSVIPKIIELKSRFLIAFIFAAGLNLIYLERGLSAILVNIVRDWFIYSLVLICVFSVKKNNKEYLS